MPCFKTQLVCLLFCCFLLFFVVFFFGKIITNTAFFFAQRDQPRDSAEKLGVELLVLA